MTCKRLGYLTVSAVGLLCGCGARAVDVPPAKPAPVEKHSPLATASLEAAPEPVPSAEEIPPVDTKWLCDEKRTESIAAIEAKTQPIEKRGVVAAGEREPADIQAIIKARYDALRACYHDALSRAPNATGRVVVRFDIQPDGTVVRLCLQEITLQDGPAVACMLDEFRGLGFGTAAKRMTVVYPIVFSPESPESPE